MRELSGIGSARRNSDPTLQIWRLAERQWGVLAWWQLMDAGIGRATVARWVAAGRLHRIYRGVYAVGHRELRDEGWLAAALLYAGRGAALSHMTAAWWWRIAQQRPPRVDVSAPGHRSSLDALAVHHPRHLERVFHRGLPLTTPARTLLDIAPTTAPRRLRRALAETLYLRLTTPEDIGSVLRRGHPGSASLRAALKSHLPQLTRTKSELEDAFVELCERFELPMPEVNAQVEGYTVDAVWRAHSVVVELDSDLAHGVAGAVHRDRARDLKLRAAGWTVLRYSWPQVTLEPDLVGRDLATVLASANPRKESGGGG